MPLIKLRTKKYNSFPFLKRKNKEYRKYRKIDVCMYILDVRRTKYFPRNLYFNNIRQINFCILQEKFKNYLLKEKWK